MDVDRSYTVNFKSAQGPGQRLVALEKAFEAGVALLASDQSGIPEAVVAMPQGIVVFVSNDDVVQQGDFDRLRCFP